MSAEAARRAATYEDLLALPENVVGHLVAGVLHTNPWPAVRHARGITKIQNKLGPAFDDGVGGPGGWILLIGPELHLGADIVVPDIAGWRRTTMPSWPDEAYVSVAPDWVCEGLSPKTAKFDRTDKLDVYREHEVGHIWFLDPGLQTLEVLRFESDGYKIVATYKDADVARLEPFDAIELDLAGLWAR